MLEFRAILRTQTTDSRDITFRNCFLFPSSKVHSKENAEKFDTAYRDEKNKKQKDKSNWFLSRQHSIIWINKKAIKKFENSRYFRAPQVNILKFALFRKLKTSRWLNSISYPDVTFYIDCYSFCLLFLEGKFLWRLENSYDFAHSRNSFRVFMESFLRSMNEYN